MVRLIFDQPHLNEESFFQGCNNLIDDRVGFVAHLVVGRVLNRMRHEHPMHLRQS